VIGVAWPSCVCGAVSGGDDDGSGEENVAASTAASWRQPGPARAPGRAAARPGPARPGPEAAAAATAVEKESAIQG